MTTARYVTITLPNGLRQIVRANADDLATTSTPAPAPAPAPETDKLPEIVKRFYANIQRDVATARAAEAARRARYAALFPKSVYRSPVPQHVVDNAPTKEALKVRREALKLSQRDLAKASGFSRGLIADVERGVRANPISRQKIGDVLSRLERAKQPKTPKKDEAPPRDETWDGLAPKPDSDDLAALQETFGPPQPRLPKKSQPALPLPLDDTRET